MAIKAWYSGTIAKFLSDSKEPVGSSTVFAQLNDNSKMYSVVPEQKEVWKEEIALLRSVFEGWNISGRIYFEYEFPRIGRRADHGNSIYFFQGDIFYLLIFGGLC